MSSIGLLAWNSLEISGAAIKKTVEKYKEATVAWLDDPDLASTIDKYGIPQNTYRKWMARNVVSTIEGVSSNSDWKIKLLSQVGAKPCQKCNTIRDIFSDFSQGQHTCKQCQQEYREANRDAHRAYTAEHYQQNKAEYKARAALRKAQILKATTAWADLAEIEKIYRSCPEGYHVDHIIPLQGDTVCGLHVENNLRHLEAQANLLKSNKLLEEFCNG